MIRNLVLLVVLIGCTISVPIDNNIDDMADALINKFAEDPPSCTDFASQEGKRLFRESLSEGNAEIFFKLASQFRTQDEPAYCGISTMVMVLNSLEVDPQRVWKGPWRFYHETMLDCCVPLDVVQKQGINILEFECLARCNRLRTKLVYGSTEEAFLTQLRKDVIASMQSEREVLVVSYDRSVLGQTGSGHFSPLAAYHAESDSVLIMDVARFKYPPHWVPLSLMQQSMSTLDNSTQRPRGYLTLSLKPDSQPLLMFGLKTQVSNDNKEFYDAVQKWKQFLSEKPSEDQEDELTQSTKLFDTLFKQFAVGCKDSLCKNQNGSPEAHMHKEAAKQVCSEVRKTKFAQKLSPAVSALMLAWPYQKYTPSKRAINLCRIVCEDSATFSHDAKNEIDRLRELFEAMMCSSVEKSCCVKQPEKNKSCCSK